MKESLWEDMQTNKLYLICKTTGNSVEVGRNMKPKAMFNDQLSGRANFNKRRLSNKDSSMPKLPLYLRKQHDLLSKYQSQSLSRSLTRNQESPKATKPGRYSVASQLDELEQQSKGKNRQKFMSLQSYNFQTDRKRKDSIAPQVHTDEKDFFMLTRFHLSKKYPQSAYKFSVDPAPNDYVKPVPLHAHITINRKNVDKKLLIQQLQRRFCDELSESKKPARLIESSQRLSLNIPSERYQPLANPEKDRELMVEAKRRQRMESERKQKLLMENYYLSMIEKTQRKSFIKFLNQAQN